MMRTEQHQALGKLVWWWACFQTDHLHPDDDFSDSEVILFADGVQVTAGDLRLLCQLYTPETIEGRQVK